MPCHRVEVPVQDSDVGLMAIQLALAEPDRGKLVSVPPRLRLLDKLVSVPPTVQRLALVPTQCQLEQTPPKAWHQALKEASLETFGGLIESSVYAAPGQTPPLEHPTQILGWTSTSGSQSGYCGLIARARSGWY